MKKYIIAFVVLTSLNFGFAQKKISINDVTLFVENDSLKKKSKNIEVVKISHQLKKQINSVSRSGLKVMDLPQSLQILDSEVIAQQQSIRISDVIKNANGVYVSSARGGAQESLFSRGYDMSANNMFKNGFRFNGGSIPEVSSLERVEFLKGGSALLFGNVTPGGILNLVTKTPSFKRGGEISMQAGSFSFFKPAIDFYGPLNSFIAYRFIGSYEKSESFRDFVKNDRVYFNPSFLINISSKTQLTLQADYLSADWTPDFGTGIIGKTILDIPRNTYFGALWSTGNTKSASASAVLNHSFNKNWKLGFNTSFQNYDRRSKSTAQMSNLDKETIYGNWKRGLVQNQNEEIILGNQLSLQGQFSTGTIKHQIFTGVDFENSLAKAYTFGFYASSTATTAITTLPAINLFNYDYESQSITAPYFTRPTQLIATETKRFGGYFQDLISITDKFKFLGGIRWSWQESEPTTTKEAITKINNVNTLTTVLDNATPVVENMRIDKAFSPKAGLIFQPNKQLSVFASYSSSFTPNSGNTVTGDPIEASIIDQFEAGVKKEFLNGKLCTNITFYQIKNNNLAQTVAFKADGITPNTDTNVKELSGATKGNGVEIDITAKPIEGLNVNAGYSYNDTRITKTSGTNGSLIEGDRLVRTPQNTANLSFFYKLPTGVFKGITFGAIGNYIGDRLGGWNDRYTWTAVTPATNPVSYAVAIEDREIPITGYTTIDVSTGYEWKAFSILVKVSNIANTLNYTVHENYSVNPIAPRQILGNIKYKF